jgi:hypothetical protein
LVRTRDYNGVCRERKKRENRETSSIGGAEVGSGTAYGISM